VIKKITGEELRVGMYIHDLNCGWLNHPFVKNQFLIDSEALLQKVQDCQIAELFIDTEQGCDVGGPPPAEKEDAPTEATADSAAKADEPAGPLIITTYSHGEEIQLARRLYDNASGLVQGMMRNARQGKQIKLDECKSVVNGIIESVSRFPSALLPLAQVKTLEAITFQHSVAVAGLSVSFGRVLGLPTEDIRELAIGGLLHDIGKAMVPGRILNKPTKLTDEEFRVMRGHASYTIRLLNNVHGISEIAFNAAAQHHERYDGSGYPGGLKGTQISLHGQMMAIVDVYDAITSIRVYHKALPATEALRKMFEWSQSQFNPKLVQAFIKGIGIYPAGSLVRMKSGRLGIVRQVSPDKLLQPIVLIVHDARTDRELPPEEVDLASADDPIISHETFEDWKIDPAKWL
jgi:putative nucleotidyltransferase with HDIG domain